MAQLLPKGLGEAGRGRLLSPQPRCPSQPSQGAAAMPMPRSWCQGAGAGVLAAGKWCRPGSSRNGRDGRSGEVFTARSNRAGWME